MNDHRAEIESNIFDLRAAGFGDRQNVDWTVRDIEELPYESFEDLHSDVVSGDAIVRMAPGGISSAVFSVLATRARKRLFNFLAVLMFGLPIAGIALGIFLSGWWFVLLLYPVLAFRLGRAVYQSALFDAVAISEAAFCFAFCGAVVTVETRDGVIWFRDMKAGSSS